MRKARVAASQFEKKLCAMVDATAVTRAAIGIFALLALTHANPVTRVSQGLISGIYVRTRCGRQISSFRGIPYAEPPVGELRFRSPMPKGPWNGTFKADRDGPQCVQITPEMGVAGHEDCLYMNVHTPKLLKANETDDSGFLLPVMIYIHGGKFVVGNGSSYLYGPDYLLEKDVVLVTMNYRLGIFGFLSTGDLVAPGNFGLKDQLVVLKWVHENIAAFGGDPYKITLFGNSAGAIMVNLHVLSDKSYGLFQQYIIQSGCILDPWAYQKNSKYVKNAESVALSYKCPTENTTVMVECLRNLTARQLASTSSIFDFYTLFAQITWGPTVEPFHSDAFITQSPIKLFLEGKGKNLPFIVGVVKDEGLFASRLLYNRPLVYKTVRNALQTTISIIMMAFADMPAVTSYNLARVIKDFYFDGNETNERIAFIEAFCRFLTDAFFLYPAYRFIEYAAHRMNGPSWFYSFEYRGTFSNMPIEFGNNTSLGVCHEDDIIYLFNVPPTTLFMPDFEMNEIDYQMVRLMVDLWTSFATEGIPMSSTLEDPFMWKIYADNTSYLEIGGQSKVNVSLKHTFHGARMRFWCYYTVSYPFGIF